MTTERTNQQPRRDLRHYALKLAHALWIATVLVGGLPILLSASAQSPLATPAGKRATLVRALVPKAAEAAPDAEAGPEAARFRRRFEQTLDVGVLLDEAFVPNVVRRNRAAGFFESAFAGLRVDPALFARLGDAELERAYVATLNLTLLFGLDALAHHPLDAEVGPWDREAIPPEIVAALSASPHLRALLDEDRAPEERISTREEFERLVADMERVAEIYRARLSPGTFERRVYVRNLELLAAKHPSTETRVGDHEPYGVASDEAVYLASDGVISCTFVDVGGSLRLISVQLTGD